MARNQWLSPHQKGIVRRYYEHKDTLMTQKLSEIVSDLYLCEDEKKAARLWESAEKALLNLDIHENRVRRVCEARAWRNSPI